MVTTYVRDLVLNEIPAYSGEQAAQFLDWLMQQGEEAFHSIPERFKRWRGGWEEIPRRICGRPGVPKEQDQLRERYTSPRCLFFLLPICSVSVDIGMLISECGVETNWGEAAMYLRWGGEKWCFLRARIDTSGSDRGHILSVLIKYNQAGHNTSPTVLSFILD